MDNQRELVINDESSGKKKNEKIKVRMLEVIFKLNTNGFREKTADPKNVNPAPFEKVKAKLST